MKAPGSARRTVLALLAAALFPILGAVVAHRLFRNGGDPDPVHFARVLTEALLSGDSRRTHDLVARQMKGSPSSGDRAIQGEVDEAIVWVAGKKAEGETLALGKTLKVEPPINFQTGEDVADAVGWVYLEVLGAGKGHVVRVDWSRFSSAEGMGYGVPIVEFFPRESHEEWMEMLASFGLTNSIHGTVGRTASNEASAISSLRYIFIGEALYRRGARKGFYAGLAGLNNANPPYIDSVLSSGAKSGYSFVGATDDGKAFTFHAFPRVQRVTGHRRFFVDQTGVIRFNDAGDATSGSPPIE